MTWAASIGLPDLVGRLVHDRQEGAGQPFGREVVEGDDGHVLGDAQAGLAEGAHHPEGNEVVGGDDGGRELGCGQDLAGHAVTVGPTVMAETQLAWRRR